MFKIAIVTALLVGCSSVAIASENCSRLYAGGFGTKFANSNQDTTLWHSPSSDGVSGGFGAIINGKKLTAPLYDSHCNNGKLILKFKQNDFSGELTGTLEGNYTTKNYRIANVSGQINGKETHTDLNFVGLN